MIGALLLAGGGAGGRRGEGGQDEGIKRGKKKARVGKVLL